MARLILAAVMAILSCLAPAFAGGTSSAGDIRAIGHFCFEAESLLKLRAAAHVGPDVVFAYDRLLVLSGACVRAPREAALVRRLAPTDPILQAELWEVDIAGRRFYALISEADDPDHGA